MKLIKNIISLFDAITLSLIPIFIKISLLLVSLYLFISTQAFINNAIPTTGTVIDWVHQYDTDNAKQCILYHPVINFTTRDGQDVKFIVQVGTTSPSYSINEKVPILYDIKDPQHAEINSLYYLWEPAFFWFLFGLSVFWVVNIKTLHYQLINRRLKSSGIKISTEIVEVKPINSSKGVTRHRVISKWQSPHNNQIYFFQSGQILIDPEKLVSRQNVDVWVCHNNPRIYMMKTGYFTMPAVEN